MSIGLKRGSVSLEAHCEEWERSAHQVIETLKYVLKDDMIDAQHIGSTAVKSICAKPVIDIAVGVNDFDRLPQYHDILWQYGIVYRGQDHPGQHLYVCGDWERDIRTHHIHAVIYGSAVWNDYVNMRDYLNTHEEEAAAYAALKEQLAAQYPNDRGAYTGGKRELIEQILEKARAWRGQ